MKIQESSKYVTKGGIMFPSSNSSYIEANTQKDKKNMHFSRHSALKCSWHTILCT